jgi:hypothetical protein
MKTPPTKENKPSDVDTTASFEEYKRALADSLGVSSPESTSRVLSFNSSPVVPKSDVSSPIRELYKGSLFSTTK